MADNTKKKNATVTLDDIEQQNQELEKQKKILSDDETQKEFEKYKKLCEALTEQNEELKTINQKLFLQVSTKVENKKNESEEDNELKEIFEKIDKYNEKIEKENEEKIKEDK